MSCLYPLFIVFEYEEDQNIRQKEHGGFEDESQEQDEIQ